MRQRRTYYNYDFMMTILAQSTSLYLRMKLDLGALLVQTQNASTNSAFTRGRRIIIRGLVVLSPTITFLSASKSTNKRQRIDCHRR